MAGLARWQNTLLTVGAALGSLCLILALAGILIGAKPLIFKSGSMAPAIEVGALGISIPVPGEQVRPGDIVSVQSAAGVRITHRVQNAAADDGGVQLTLKGDANAVADAENYAAAEVDKVIFSIPLLGYAVAWLGTPAAIFVGGLLTAYLLYLAFVRRPPQPNTDGPDVGGNDAGQRAAAVITAGVLLAGAGAIASATPAQAAFRDSAPASAAFSALQLPAPGGVTCVRDSRAVTFSWTAPAGVTSYTLSRVETNAAGVKSTLAPETFSPARTSDRVTPSSLGENGADAVIGNTYEIILSAHFADVGGWSSSVKFPTVVVEKNSYGNASLRCVG